MQNSVNAIPPSANGRATSPAILQVSTSPCLFSAIGQKMASISSFGGSEVESGYCSESSNSEESDSVFSIPSVLGPTNRIVDRVRSQAPLAPSMRERGELVCVKFGTSSYH